MKKPIFLRTTFKPSHKDNRMKHEGDVQAARTHFFKAPNNLRQLLKHRYDWMNKYIKKDQLGIEVGSGTGLSKEFIKKENFKTTDLAGHEWLDFKNIDALDTEFQDNKFDFIISSNMIHHVPYPVKFFKEMSRILKPQGLLLIQEINASFFMRLLLRLMKHEGYSYDINVFNQNEVCTDKNDLWSANCAIPNLLFDDKENFEKHIPYFQISKTSFSEFFCFINSGGVISKTIYIPLPIFALKLLGYMDSLLVKIFPSIFALQRQIVLKNIK